MVTRILFDPRTDNPDGTQAALQAVTIEATPTGIREDGSVFILPSTLTFATTTGAAPILLSAPSASTAWRLAVKNAGQLRQTRIVRFPDVPSITWAALTDVDPASLGTTPGHARQWDATFAELVTLIGSGGSGYLPLWKANTAYTAGQFVVSPTGQIIQANTTFTSGSTYNAANWTVVTGGGGGGAVSSVAGRTGAVTLTAADVALGNVNNTSDAAKPISSAQATVNAVKADLVGGLVPTSQIPALALNTGVTVASQAAMLALTTTQVQPGDLAIRTDGAGTFILTATDPTQLANWVRLNAPTDVVTSVNSQTGTVVLAKGDVGLGSVDNTADTAKPVSTAQATAIGAKLDAFTTPVTLTAAGTLTANVQNLLDATAGPFTATLPTPTKVGQLLVVERVDTSVNLITIAGTIRGVTNVSPTLPGLGATGESIAFAAESLTSWRPIASHKPKALLDKQFSALTSPAILGSATRQVGTGFQRPIRAGSYQPYLGPVSNRGRIPAGGVGINTYAEYMTWRLYKAADDIPAAALIYASFFGTAENGATGVTGTVQASIEYPIGTITRITFGSGSNAGTIPTNGTVQSDLTPLATTIPAGARFWVGSYVQWSGTGNVPRFQDGMYIQSGTANAQATAARESNLASATPGTLTNTILTGARGTNAGLSALTGDSYGPTAILGMTQRPTVFIAGDSEAMEQFPPAITAQDSEGIAGVVEQIIGNRVGMINAALASDSYAAANAAYTNRLALSLFCTHVIDQYGVNSVYGQTLTQNTTDFTTFRGKFPATKPYLKTTVIPKVNGTSIKPDLSDQTVVTVLANFTAFNNFVRQGMNGLIDGHIELEDVTGFRDTGKIKPAQRYVTDVSTTAGSNIITSATANFLASDIGKVICVLGAGASSANLIGVISTVTSSTTATVNATNSQALTSGTAVTGAAAGIGLYSYDGIHPTRLRQADIRDSIQAQRAIALILALG